MTEIRGTNLASAVVPFTTDDAFPTHFAKYGNGGWQEVETTANRDAITTNRREAGMAVYVRQDSKLYILNADLTTWSVFETGKIDTIKVNGTEQAIVNKTVDIAVPEVINNVTSTSTDNALSANMGKELNDRIDNLEGIGRYLSNWNCVSGLPTTNPTTQTYTYKTGDYFLVGIVASSGGVNYKPDGSSYTIDVPSTTVESEEVAVGDIYMYDGSVWKLLKNTQKSVTFANIAGDPYDNSNLSTALNAKQDNLPTLETGKFLTNNGSTLSWATVTTANAVDGITVSRNASDQLQAIGTINKNTSGGALYDWKGTLAEYTAQNIATTHPEWICFVTDDSTNINWGDIQGTLANQTDLQTALNAKQDTLVSGTNIKTINSNSIVGSGNLDIDGLPSQATHSGQFLTTDGTSASWATVDALPSQATHSGQFLTTDGSSASWATVDALPSQSGQSGKFLTTDGTSASWATVPTPTYDATNEKLIFS